MPMDSGQSDSLGVTAMLGDAVAREDQWEAEGIELRKCACGTAKVEAIPDRAVGLRCAGCTRVIE